MIFELEHCIAPSRQREGLKRLLASGPWCWPADDDDERLAFARRIAQRDVPTLAPGEAPVVAVSDAATSLWVMTAARRAAGRPTEWGNDALAAWDRATIAVPRSLPLLWASVQTSAAHPPLAYHLASWPRPNHSGLPEPLLDRPSFGLSFALAITSRLFNQALPSDLIASAQVGSDGRVSAIAGLADKLEGIRALAPRITRVLIAADQEEASFEGCGLTIKRVASVAAAVTYAFGDRRLAELLVEAGRNRSARSELVASFFRLIADGRGAIVDWTPVESAAALALAEWDDLTDDERIELKFARAVAARHEDNRGELSIPPATWFAGKPMPLRVGLIANLVQQAADTGVPAAADVERLAHAYVTGAHNAHVPQLKLLGALGRLWAVNGRPLDAMRVQENVAEAFFASFEQEQVSYPLTEWYRLAGACGDSLAWTRAEEMRRRIRLIGGFGRHAKPYVDLARARSQIRLGLTDGDDPGRTLRELGDDADIPVHVRWSALRWRVYLGDALEDPELSETVVRVLDAAVEAGGRGASQALLFRTLVELDRLIRLGALDSARTTLGTLASLEPGPIDQLIAAAPESAEPGYVATFYPY